MASRYDRVDRSDLDSSDASRVGAPGKTTLTQRLAAAPSPSPTAAPSARAIDPAMQRECEWNTAAAFGFFGGPAATIAASCAALSTPVQRSVDAHTGLSETAIASHAARGVSDGGSPLPHLDAIQRSFGSAHDLSDVRAHVGGAAAEASAAIGAQAYATGRDVAFASSPDLFLAAHEATHVVQQRSGVSLKGAVGQVGDAYEDHADQVAAAVVRGDSAAPLLEGGPGASGGAVVARKNTPREPSSRAAADPAVEVDVVERSVELGETFRVRWPKGSTITVIGGGGDVDPLGTVTIEGTRGKQYRATKAGALTVIVKQGDSETHQRITITPKAEAAAADTKDDAGGAIERSVGFGETFRIGWPEGSTIMVIGGGGEVASLGTLTSGTKRVKQYRATKPGLVTVVVTDGDASTQHRIAIAAHGIEAVTRSGRTLRANALNVITRDDDAAINVRFRWFGDAVDRDQLTIHSEEVAEPGTHGYAFTVGKGEWTGDNEIAWSILAQRAGAATANFRVMQAGVVIAEASYQLERKVESADVEDLFVRARTLAARLGLHLRGWAAATGFNYTAAFANVKDAIASDQEAEAFINDAAVSIAGVVLSGFGGGALKAGASFTSAFLEGFCSELVGNGSGMLVEIGAGLVGQYIKKTEAERVEPLRYFLKLQHFGTSIEDLVASLLTSWQDEMEKSPSSVEDPLPRIEKAMASQGLPFIVPTADGFEREAWKEWVKRNDLEHWSGRDRVAIIARLDALGVAYKKLGSYFDDMDPSALESESSTEMLLYQQRRKGQDQRDAVEAKDFSARHDKAKQNFADRGAFPTIVASGDGIKR